MGDRDGLRWGAIGGLWLGAIVPQLLIVHENTATELASVWVAPVINPPFSGIVPSPLLPPLIPEVLLPAQFDRPFPDPIAQQLNDTARSITVKVLSGESWGSGIAIARQGKQYTIVTNAHVVSAQETIRIQTPDDRVYAAVSVEVERFKGYDLAIVTFESEGAEYPIATIADAPRLQEGDPLVAVGFPFSGDPAVDAGFKFTMGRVALIPELSLIDGYQIGYTNDVEKGMSGGPVLNRRGEVVAINGMHAYPLWGNPYIYQDGSHPCVPMHEIMERSSWAIPVQTFLRVNAGGDASLTPQQMTAPPQPLVALQPTQTDAGSPVEIDPAPSFFVRQLQQQADRAKHCGVETETMPAPSGLNETVPLDSPPVSPPPSSP